MSIARVATGRYDKARKAMGRVSNFAGGAHAAHAIDAAANFTNRVNEAMATELE